VNGKRGFALRVSLDFPAKPPFLFGVVSFSFLFPTPNAPLRQTQSFIVLVTKRETIFRSYWCGLIKSGWKPIYSAEEKRPLLHMEGKYIFQSRYTIFFIIQRNEFKIRPQFEHSACVFLRDNISYCYYSNRTDGKETVTCQVNKAKKPRQTNNTQRKDSYSNISLINQRNIK